MKKAILILTMFFALSSYAHAGMFNDEKHLGFKIEVFTNNVTRIYYANKINCSSNDLGIEFIDTRTNERVELIGCQVIITKLKNKEK